jgi:hypothetical protein
VVNLKSAINSTLEHAKTLMQTASTITSARTATNPVTPRRIVYLGPDEVYGLQLKYLYHNLWKDTPSLSPTTAEWSETARPLPRPSMIETTNSIALKTIADNPTLFQV